MGIATRFYIFLEDGSLRRVPQRIGYELPFGRDAIPEFAGTRQRVATVLVESENGKPLRILDSRGLYWTFNDEGRIDDDLRQQWADHLDVLSPRAASKKGLPVVDLVPEIERRKRRAQYAARSTMFRKGSVDLAGLSIAAMHYAFGELAVHVSQACSSTTISYLHRTLCVRTTALRKMVDPILPMIFNLTNELTVFK